MKLAGRVALVTGAGSGIGRAIARRFAAEGAQVVVNDLRLDAARETVAALGPGTPPGHHAVAADVADSAQVRRMFAEVGERFGRLDVLVNNAGIGAGPAERALLQDRLAARAAESAAGGPVRTHWDFTRRLSDEAWLGMIATHLNGTFFCTREALGLMGDGGGAIVNLSSVAALTGIPTATHYSAAKGGILAFTRAVAQEVASRGIRVNAICPGYIDTPMTRPMPEASRRGIIARTPMGRLGEPDEVAAAALFLASEDGAYFTGQWLSPNGGLFIG